ncbi:hypothetical protein, partial [Chthonomonas calidirosea]
MGHGGHGVFTMHVPLVLVRK